MSDLQLIEAIKNGDGAKAEELIKSGADLNQQDEQGWTPLCFAAGKGDLKIVTFLVENGADVFKVGRDLRPPYMIALAAGRVDVVKYLKEAEDKVTDGKPTRPERKYCMAYYLGDLRKFPGWSENEIGQKAKASSANNGDAPAGLADNSIVYLHGDFTVTKSIWRNEQVIFNQVDDSWKKFCTEALNFKVPDDLDLAVTASVS